MKRELGEAMGMGPEHSAAPAAAAGTGVVQAVGTSAREAFREAFRKGFREAIAGWFNRGDRVRNPAELERPPRTEASVYGDIHYHPAPNPAPPTAGGAPDTSDDRATV